MGEEGVSMSRQVGTPVLWARGASKGQVLAKLPFAASPDQIDENALQNLVDQCPECLPIWEIDRAFEEPVSICRELSTSAGQIDNFLVTRTGLPILVECKLWRNGEARREVVGQIVDYARTLTKWTVSDLDREVSKRLKASPPVSLFDLVSKRYPNIDELSFNDAVTRNLKTGRFMLLIVGDGIREGVEAIADYLQNHAGLRFVFGLIELPVFVTPAGERLFVPRVLAKTVSIEREVAIDGPSGDEPPINTSLERTSGEIDRLRFWSKVLVGLQLDDPEQVIPKPGNNGYVSFMLPAPRGSSWLTVYREVRTNETGVFLSSSRASAGEYAMQSLAARFDEIAGELQGTARVIERDGRPTIIDSFRLRSSWADESSIDEAALWLRERINTFVNVLRPRVKSLVADYIP